jgi:hypothetical protein
MSLTLNVRRAQLVLLSLVVTFALLRLWLHNFPNTDLNVGAYNIHHLFTGLLLITLGGVPLAILQGSSRWLDVAALVFGIGLSLALDEWVYLITTDGTNASYLLPISVWGGVAMTGLACGYVLLLIFLSARKNRTSKGESHV